LLCVLAAGHAAKRKRSPAAKARSGKAEVIDDSASEPGDESASSEESSDAEDAASADDSEPTEPQSDRKKPRSRPGPKPGGSGDSRQLRGPGRTKAESTLPFAANTVIAQAALRHRYRTRLDALAELYSSADTIENVFSHIPFNKAVAPSAFTFLDSSQLIIRGHERCVINLLPAPVPGAAHAPAVTSNPLLPLQSMQIPSSAFSDWLIHAGGPVTALDWCPVGDSSHAASACDQYLAVATTAHRYRFANVRYASPHYVQLWRTPAPSLTNVTAQARTPELALTFEHPFGVVLDLRWFPYGVWQPSESAAAAAPARLGVLAVASGDGAVYIYSVPHPTNASERSGRIARVVLQPQVKLAVPGANFWRIKWARHQRQRLLAISQDGAVAVWDLSSLHLLYTDPGVTGSTASGGASAGPARAMAVIEDSNDNVASSGTSHPAAKPVSPAPLYFMRAHVAPSMREGSATVCVRDAEFDPNDADIFVTVGDDQRARVCDLKAPFDVRANASVSLGGLGAVVGCAWIPGTSSLLCATEWDSYQLVDMRDLGRAYWKPADVFPDATTAHLTSAQIGTFNGMVPTSLDVLYPLSSKPLPASASTRLRYVPSKDHRIGIASSTASGCVLAWYMDVANAVSPSCWGDSQILHAQRCETRVALGGDGDAVADSGNPFLNVTITSDFPVYGCDSKGTLVFFCSALHHHDGLERCVK